jgi:hypothetical protein
MKTYKKVPAVVLEALWEAGVTPKLERALTRDESFQAQNFVKDLQKGKHKVYSVLALISTGQAT